MGSAGFRPAWLSGRSCRRKPAGADQVLHPCRHHGSFAPCPPGMACVACRRLSCASIGAGTPAGGIASQAWQCGHRDPRCCPDGSDAYRSHSPQGGGQCRACGRPGKCRRQFSRVSACPGEKTVASGHRAISTASCAGWRWRAGRRWHAAANGRSRMPHRRPVGGPGNR